MKRMMYQKPTTEVVKLQQRSQLLSGSADGQAGMQNYNWNSVDEE